MSVGAEQLHTQLAIAHVGPRAGRPAPRLDLRSTDGVTMVVPAGRRQVLLFADHSLLDFGDLLDLLTAGPDDGADRPDSRRSVSADRTSAALLAGLELRVPLAVVPHAVYDRYRVRVMPYAVVVDAAGRVATSGLVNSAFQLRHLAQVGLDAEAGAGQARRPEARREHLAGGARAPRPAHQGWVALVLLTSGRQAAIEAGSSDLQAVLSAGGPRR